MTTYTHETVIHKVALRHRGKIQVEAEPRYKGSKSKIQVTCTVHGNTWLTRADRAIWGGSQCRCPICYREGTWTNTRN